MRLDYWKTALGFVIINLNKDWYSCFPYNATNETFIMVQIVKTHQWIFPSWQEDSLMLLWPLAAMRHDHDGYWTWCHIILSFLAHIAWWSGNNAGFCKGVNKLIMKKKGGNGTKFTKTTEFSTIICVASVILIYTFDS